LDDDNPMLPANTTANYQQRATTMSKLLTQQTFDDHAPC
jgi:hypothetical protein